MPIINWQVEKIVDCKVPFKGLKEGKHEFLIELNDDFVSKQGIEAFKDLNVEVHLRLIKRERFLEAIINVSGNATTECDRCLDDMSLEIETESKFIVKIDNELTDEDDDEIIYVKETEHELDLTQTIYEIIVLAIPLKKVHPNDEDGIATCNSSMLSFINSEDNIPSEEDGSREEDIDPRWAGLKNIKFNDN